MTDTDDRVERVALAIGDAIWGTSARNDTPENWDRALTYARAAIAAANEWRPIETLPKHAGDVLLYYPKQTGRNAMSEWITVGTGHTHRKPTHWMPLPQPPEAQ